MKQGTNFTNSENRKICFLVLLGTILIGMIIGSFIGANGNMAINSNTIFNQYISPLSNGETLFDVFRNTFLSTAFLISIIFCIGFFAVGQPLAVVLLLYRGIGIGISIADIYMQYGVKGVYISLLLIMPKVIATVIIIILSVREALKLSNRLYRYIFSGTTEDDMLKYIKLYCIKFLVLIIFVFIVSILDSGLNYFFDYML